MKRLLLIGFAVLILSGCATYETRTEGATIEDELVTTIETGTTTRKEILEKFGTPTEITVEGEEELMVYDYTVRKVPSYIGGMVEVPARSEVTNKRLEIKIRYDKVLSYKYVDKTR